MRLAAALALMAALAKPAAAADYPMFKGSPTRLGRSTERLGAPVRLAWKKDWGGAFYSSPALLSGTAYLGNSNHKVYALALEDGALKWQATLPERIYGSSPQAGNGLLSIACVDGCIHTLDLADGSERSQVCVKKLGTFGPGPDILGSPLIDSGRLYFGSDNHEIYCYDAKNGQKRWSYATGNRVHDAAPALSGKTLLMASTDGCLYALDKEAGWLLWKSESFGRLNTTPMIHAGRVYLGGEDRSLRCLDLSSGALVWRFDGPKSIMSSPALSEDGKSLVFGDSGGQVYCLGLDGILKWKFKAGGPVLSSPLVTGPTAWIASFDGRFCGLDMAGGSLVFDFESKDSFFSSPAASGGRILLGGRDGLAYCFEATHLK